MLERPLRMELAHEFLDDAKHLLEGGSLRSAISRAYYAAYHACVWALEHEGYLPENFRRRDGTRPSRWEHGIICYAFHQVFGLARRCIEHRLTRMLPRLYAWRIDADYHPDAMFAEAEAQEAINLASELISVIEEVVL